MHTTGVVLSMSRSELEPCLVGDWERGRFAGCIVALALLFAVVMQGDAYLFSPPRRVQRWGSLVEQPLPASSLNRNSRKQNDRGSFHFSRLGLLGHRCAYHLNLPPEVGPR